MDMQWCDMGSGNDLRRTWDMSESQSKHTKLKVTYTDEQQHTSYFFFRVILAFRVLFGAGDGSADSTALQVCPFLNLAFGGWGSSSDSVSTLRWSSAELENSGAGLFDLEGLPCRGSCSSGSELGGGVIFSSGGWGSELPALGAMLSGTGG